MPLPVATLFLTADLHVCAPFPHPTCGLLVDGVMPRHQFTELAHIYRTGSILDKTVQHSKPDKSKNVGFYIHLMRATGAPNIGQVSFARLTSMASLVQNLFSLSKRKLEKVAPSPETSESSLVNLYCKSYFYTTFRVGKRAKSTKTRRFSCFLHPRPFSQPKSGLTRVNKSKNVELARERLVQNWTA